jgi:regulator of protease activity HflC (stomatin/prohibitin superfamily)
MSFGWNYLTGRREYKSGAVTIYEYERGLLYKNGKLLRVLEAGRYRLWRWNHTRIEVVDVRRQSVQIANQKLLTSDQVTVTINIVADYEIADVALATHSVANHQSQLYEDVQLAARNIVGSVSVDDLLEKRLEINAQLQEAVVGSAASYGVRVLAVGVKDVILAAKVRDLLMKEVEAKRVAQAMLIGAREEVAAMRALVNAARLAADNPALLRLRELEVARAFSANGGNTVVMGLSENAALLKGNGAKAQANSDAPDEDVNDA